MTVRSGASTGLGPRAERTRSMKPARAARVATRSASGRAVRDSACRVARWWTAGSICRQCFAGTGRLASTSGEISRWKSVKSAGITGSAAADGLAKATQQTQAAMTAGMELGIVRSSIPPPSGG